MKNGRGSGEVFEAAADLAGEVPAAYLREIARTMSICGAR